MEVPSCIDFIRSCCSLLQHICSILPGRKAAFPNQWREVASYLRDLDHSWWSLGGFPRWRQEREWGESGSVSSHQTAGPADPGARAGNKHPPQMIFTSNHCGDIALWNGDRCESFCETSGRNINFHLTVTFSTFTFQFHPIHVTALNMMIRSLTGSHLESKWIKDVPHLI